MTATITQRERELMRHALSFKRRMSSYPKLSIAAAGDDRTVWIGLVERGLAKRTDSNQLLGSDFFLPTRAGAEAALEPGEQLDSEDLPDDPIARKRAMTAALTPSERSWRRLDDMLWRRAKRQAIERAAGIS